MRIGRNILLRVSGVLALAAAWQITGHINDSPAFPPLNRVLWALYIFIRDGPFSRHVSASLTIVMMGIGIAVTFGFALGLLMFRYNSFRMAFLPIVESVRGVAALTLFPLLIVLIGLGTVSRVFVIFWTAWPAVTLSTLNSLNIDSNLVDAARSFGAGEWRIIFNIRIPVGSQGIITGIRIGAGGGWISLIAAEMLGATQGLGFYLLWSSQSFQFERVYAVIIVIAVIGGLMNLALLLLQKKLLKITGGT